MQGKRFAVMNDGARGFWIMIMDVVSLECAASTMGFTTSGNVSLYTRFDLHIKSAVIKCRKNV